VGGRLISEHGEKGLSSVQEGFNGHEDRLDKLYTTLYSALTCHETSSLETTLKSIHCWPYRYHF